MFDGATALDIAYTAPAPPQPKETKPLVRITVDSRTAVSEWAMMIKDALLMHARRKDGENSRCEIILTTSTHEISMKMPWRLFYPSTAFYEALRQIPGITGVYSETENYTSP